MPGSGVYTEPHFVENSRLCVLQAEGGNNQWLWQWFLFLSFIFFSLCPSLPSFLLFDSCTTALQLYSGGYCDLEDELRNRGDSVTQVLKCPGSAAPESSRQRLWDCQVQQLISKLQECFFFSNV